MTAWNPSWVIPRKIARSSAKISIFFPPQDHKWVGSKKQNGDRCFTTFLLEWKNIKMGIVSQRYSQAQANFLWWWHLIFVNKLLVFKDTRKVYFLRQYSIGSKTFGLLFEILIHFCRRFLRWFSFWKVIWVESRLFSASPMNLVQAHSRLDRYTCLVFTYQPLKLAPEEEIPN